MKIFVKFLCMVLAVSLITFSPNFAGAGEVTGTVKFEGAVPKFREIKMDADPICLSKHGSKVFPDTLVLGEGNTMKNVFVYVKDGIFDNKFTPPAEPVVISQTGCMYEPHIIGLMVGQPLKILNPDGTLHNVHALSKVNPEFNLAMPKFRREATQVFGKPEFMFPLKCDVHPWMSAWISVMDNPFFAITGINGEFRISNLPKGNFHIVAWHEKLGTLSEDIVITGGNEEKINFVFSKP